MSQLNLVSLPIGNLADITKRALDTLTNASVIFCEDTKSFRKLMGLLDISLEGKQIDSFHDHSQYEKVQKIIQLLNQRRDVVFVSEAGSPIVSDPAFPIVDAIANETDHKIETIPGCSSVIAAIELAALPATPFHFHGFLPRDKNAVQLALRDCFNQYGTHVLFESPNRIEKTADILCGFAPEDSKIVICREITKKFQQVLRFTPADWPEKRSQMNFQGECVLLVYVSKENVLPSAEIEQIKELAEKVLAKPGHVKTLSKLLSKILDTKTDEIYKQLNS
jgi:16S rRNA (cytidine1402-2'-O)-methyltransferase